MCTLRSRTWAVAPMLVVALLGTEKVSGFVTVSFMLPRAARTTSPTGGGGVGEVPPSSRDGGGPERY